MHTGVRESTTRADLLSLFESPIPQLRCAARWPLCSEELWFVYSLPF